MNLDPVLDPREVVSNDARLRVVLVDARSGPDAHRRYQERHLEGALHADLDHDLALRDHDPAQGGRHPLPDQTAFSRVLGFLGIAPASHVVVYDDKGGAIAAARLWWMLRAAGIRRVQVLDGGLEAAIAAGVPVGTRGQRPTVRSPKPFQTWAAPIAEVEEVAEATCDPKRLVIDARAPERYRGEDDPFEQTPGHIPGSINVPFVSNLNAEGRFLSAKELAQKYRAVLGDRAPTDVIVSCGSGVTACHTLLAMERAGLRGAKLYVGSYSEWSRTGRPIATGSEPEGEAR